MDSRFKKDLAHAMARQYLSIADIDFKPACVMLLLFQKVNSNGQIYILAIQKADTEGYPWRNQVALPGGHIDIEDHDSVAAVFRELKEELAIRQQQVDLIGSLGHFQTIHKIDIEAFVGVWEQSAPVIFDPLEIANIVEIPVQYLFATHFQMQFNKRLPGVSELVYPVQDVNVWGATARIFHHFIEISFPIFRQHNLTRAFSKIH